MEKMWVSRAHALAAVMPQQSKTAKSTVAPALTEEIDMTPDQAIQRCFTLIGFMQDKINNLEQNVATLDGNVKKLANRGSDGPHTYRVTAL